MITVEELASLIAEEVIKTKDWRVMSNGNVYFVPTTSYTRIVVNEKGIYVEGAMFILDDWMDEFIGLSRSIRDAKAKQKEPLL